MKHLQAGLIAITVIVSTSLSYVASNTALAAGTASISGTVTDNAGEPVRGAIVKAELGNTLHARYSSASGHYEIDALAPGQYEVTVDAFGFALATQKTEAGDRAVANFSLSPDYDPARLKTAQLQQLLPDNKEHIFLVNRCSSCHGLETVVASVAAGMPAAAWEAFLPVMPTRRMAVYRFGPELSARLGTLLVEHLGPDGVLARNGNTDFSRIQTPPINDKVLQAKITEYKIPSPDAMPHSVRVDPDSGLVWSTMYDAPSNSFMRFDPQAESFKEFLEIQIPESLPHTGAVLPDGRYIVTLARDAVGPIKMIIASPDGELENVEYPEKSQGARVVAVDPSNGDVVWVVADAETWRYNVRTKTFTTYDNPLPDAFPEGSYAGIYAAPGARPTNRDGYSITVDSKGIPWITQLELGLVLRLDPESGGWTTFHSPEMQSARGIEADAHDNIWFGDFHGRQLGVVDGQTGEIRFYTPPTKNSSPYGITVDLRNDYIWYGDTHANYATRFDPRTSEFVEYPLASPNASVRFMGIDAAGRIWYGGYWNERLGLLDPGDSPRGLISSR